jgi:hypothetical protein
VQSGICTLAGTLCPTAPPQVEKNGRPRVGKPRQLKLLGDQLVAVDENQTARVERHRPSSRGANYMVLTDSHCVPRFAQVRFVSNFDVAGGTAR